MTTQVPAAVSTHFERERDSPNVERVAGMRSFDSGSADVGAEPCRPIYVYTWRARFGGYVALVAMLIAVGYFYVARR